MVTLELTEPEIRLACSSLAFAALYIEDQALSVQRRVDTLVRPHPEDGADDVFLNALRRRVDLEAREAELLRDLIGRLGAAL